MITVSAQRSNQESDWQNELKRSFHHIYPFLEYIGLADLYSDKMEQAQIEFKFRITRHFADRIEKGNANDPILKQFLPDPDELNSMPGYVTDPLQDQHACQSAGLLQKYAGRALLISTAACAVHCRYCFRRHFPYADHQWNESNWQASLAYIRSHPEIDEIILSGGDPLMLPDEYLNRLFQDLNDLEQIERIRVHTRLPVILPQRIDSSLLSLLDLNKPNSWVLHINHPNEISPELEQKTADLRSAGIILFNQAVLLKGINDQVSIQIELCKKLFASGIIPYYLHQLDRVAGSARFEVSDSYALDLYQKMQAALPGYLVPKLVKEIPGMVNKMLLVNQYEDRFKA